MVIQRTSRDLPVVAAHASPEYCEDESYDASGHVLVVAGKAVDFDPDAGSS
jgi:hypothetical protein